MKWNDPWFLLTLGETTENKMFRHAGNDQHISKWVPVLSAWGDFCMILQFSWKIGTITKTSIIYNNIRQ